MTYIIRKRPLSETLCFQEIIYLYFEDALSMDAYDGNPRISHYKHRLTPVFFSCGVKPTVTHCRQYRNHVKLKSMFKATRITERRTQAEHTISEG